MDMDLDTQEKKRKRSESPDGSTEPWYLSNSSNQLGPIGIPATQNTDLDPSVVGTPLLHPSMYETLPSNAIDYNRWSKIFYKISESIMELVYGKAGQEYRKAKKSLKEPYTKIATIATNIYADLHGRLALEINRDIICDGTLIPFEDQKNLIQAATKKAQQSIDIDQKTAFKNQQVIDASFAKALSSWQLDNEKAIDNGDTDYIEVLYKNRPEAPPSEPFLHIEEESLPGEINKRVPIELRKNYYINVSDAVIEFRKQLERIMDIYENILPPNEERSTYKDSNNEQHKLLLLEYLLISIILDTKVDVPDLLTSDDALQNAINAKLCGFYASFEKHPELNEAIEPIIGYPTTLDNSGNKIKYAIGLSGTKPVVRLLPRYVVPDMPSSGVLTDIIGPDGKVIKTVDGYVANFKLKKIGEEGAVRDDINGYQIDVENTPDIFAASTTTKSTTTPSEPNAQSSVWSMLFGNTKGGIKTRKQQKKNKKRTIRKQHKNGTHKKHSNTKHKNKTSSKK